MINKQKICICIYLNNRADEYELSFALSFHIFYLINLLFPDIVGNRNVL